MLEYLVIILLLFIIYLCIDLKKKSDKKIKPLVTKKQFVCHVNKHLQRRCRWI